METNSKTDSETAWGKINEGAMNPEDEAAYRREHRSKEPYANKYPYEQFEHAYRTGYDSFLKNPDKRFG